MKIAIPSKGRIDFPAKKLCESIPQDTYVFVNPSEYNLYLKNNPNNFNIVSVTEEKNLTYVMEFINEFFNEKFVLIDDDVSGLSVRDGLTKGEYPKLRSLKSDEIKQAFDDIEKCMKDYGLSLLCLREVQSNWYSKSILELANVGYRVVFFDGKAIKDKNLHYDKDIYLNSDVEFYIQMAKAGLRIGTYFKYAFSSVSEKFDTSGGCSEVKNKAYTLNDCNKVFQKHNMDKNIKIKLHPKFNRHGIVCNWKKLSPLDYWSKICV